MDKNAAREIKRMRQILSQIVSMAEDEEMAGGVSNAVRRFNAIVRHLENSDVLPRDLFPMLDEQEGAISYHQVGAESRMLSGYLEEVIDEEEGEADHTRPDFSPVIALAPFLDQNDLKALIHSHLSGRGFTDQGRPESHSGQPDISALVGLAPHIAKRDLAEMLEACLARGQSMDPSVLTALAPHVDRADLGRILRKYAPTWFGGAPEPPTPPMPPAAPAPPEAPAAPEPGQAISRWQDVV